VTSRRPAGAGWSRIDVIALVLVAALGGGLRLAELGNPSTLMFDETYYARDACLYTETASARCGVQEEQTLVHPPLGKRLIAAGIALVGYDSTGWRAAAAVAGTATIALLFVLARRLLESTLAATVAAGLLALDPLHFVQSRIAMLDVFVGLFTVAAVLFAVLDREATLRGHSRSFAARHESHLARPWRAAAGIAAGAAAASKWSGVLTVLTVLALAVTWELSARRSGGHRGAWLSIGVWLMLAPAAVYMASYWGRLDGAVLALPWGEGAWLRALWDRQLYMLDFHSTLEVTHHYQSPPWSWPLLKRPVSYFFGTDSRGRYMEVLATGSPLVWWAALGALAYLAGRWLAVRDPARPEGTILAGFAWAYLPWLALGDGRDAVFLFYLLPAVPFMCLALGSVARDVERERWGPPAVGLFCAATVALFAFYHPVLTTAPLPRSAWLDRIWIFDNCSESVRAADADRESDDRPPPGWCWI
jgi:dolichyl-phosphate-mannose-protein mannosyltransferase